MIAGDNPAMAAPYVVSSFNMRSATISLRVGRAADLGLHNNRFLAFYCNFDNKLPVGKPAREGSAQPGSTNATRWNAQLRAVESFLRLNEPVLEELHQLEKLRAK